MILSVHVPYVPAGHTKQSHFGPVASGTVLFLRYQPKVKSPVHVSIAQHGHDWRQRYSTLDDRRSLYVPINSPLVFGDHR